MTVNKLEHVGIMVSSLEDSIEFYQRVIGLQLLETMGPIGEHVRLAFMAFQGQTSVEIELVEGASDSSLPNEGKVHHVAFSVEGIEDEYERIKRLGLDGLDPEITTLPNGSRYFFFDGPDGERLEFFQSTRG
ncbi:VOC family protein [Paenibacillus sp. JX-17]|uniref:VOC family protein n=1 Tax=Paenibacillus lacisoli TaxID=3064525 RepID=A0ABT9CDV0_9BACL|nr:VOC family protein [Paenibacillus sp. JX-17]MDO7907442.1 VOC family protein [Paenibacillus sp. JX-17]